MLSESVRTFPQVARSSVSCGTDRVVDEGAGRMVCSNGQRSEGRRFMADKVRFSRCEYSSVCDLDAGLGCVCRFWMSHSCSAYIHAHTGLRFVHDDTGTSAEGCCSLGLLTPEPNAVNLQTRLGFEHDFVCISPVYTGASITLTNHV